MHFDSDRRAGHRQGMRQPTPLSFPETSCRSSPRPAATWAAATARPKGKTVSSSASSASIRRRSRRDCRRKGAAARVSLRPPEQSLLLRKATAAEPHGGGQRMDVEQPPLSPPGALDRRRGAATSSTMRRRSCGSKSSRPSRCLLAKENRQLRVWAVDESRRAALRDDRGRVRIERRRHRRRRRPRLRASRRHAGRSGDSGPLPRARHRLPRHDSAARRRSYPAAGSELHRPAWPGTSWNASASSRAPCATTPRSCAACISTSSARCRPPTKPARFLADKAADKRAKLVDDLLERPEYADYWTMRFSDLLRVDQRRSRRPARWRSRAGCASSSPRIGRTTRWFATLLHRQRQREGRRAGGVFQGARHAGADGPQRQPGVPRRADRMCPVPSSSVRPLGPRRLLRDGRHVQRRDAQEAAPTAAKRSLPGLAKDVKHPRTGERDRRRGRWGPSRSEFDAVRQIAASTWPSG